MFTEYKFKDIVKGEWYKYTNKSLKGSVYGQYGSIGYINTVPSQTFNSHHKCNIANEHYHKPITKMLTIEKQWITFCKVNDRSPSLREYVKSETRIFRNAIKCDTKVEADELLIIADRLGFKWCDNKRFILDNRYGTYPEMYYDIKTGSFGSIKGAKDGGRTVINYLEWIENNRSLISNVNLKSKSKDEVFSKKKEIRTGSNRGTAYMASRRQQVSTGSRPKGNKASVNIGKTRVRHSERSRSAQHRSDSI